MKLKSLLLVVALLAACSALVYLGQRPAPSVPEDARLDQALFSAAEVERATQIRLEDQGRIVTRVRQSDGIWGVASYFDLPADFTKLSAFMGSLAEAKLQRLVTTRPERLARLEFKGTKIALVDAADQEFQSVTLGKNAESNNGRYVRFGAEPKAYLTNFNAAPDLEPRNWADSRLLDLKPEDIATLDISFPDGKNVSVSHPKKEEPWMADQTPAGHRINAGKVASLLGLTGNVRFSNTLAPDDATVAAAKAHQRVVKLTTFGGQTYTVALGRTPEEKKLPPAIAPPALVPALEHTVGAPAAGVTPIPADQNPGEARPYPPESNIIPAGPVIVFIHSSDPAARVNTLMKKRAFLVPDYSFTGLPQTPAELFEAIPPGKPESAPSGEPKKG